MAVNAIVDVALVGEQVALADFLVGFIVLEEKLVDILIIFKCLLILRYLRRVLVFLNFFIDIAKLDVFIVKCLTSEVFQFLTSWFGLISIRS